MSRNKDFLKAHGNTFVTKRLGNCEQERNQLTKNRGKKSTPKCMGRQLKGPFSCLVCPWQEMLGGIPLLSSPVFLLLICFISHGASKKQPGQVLPTVGPPVLQSPWLYKHLVLKCFRDKRRKARHKLVRKLVMSEVISFVNSDDFASLWVTNFHHWVSATSHWSKH